MRNIVQSDLLRVCDTNQNHYRCHTNKKLSFLLPMRKTTYGELSLLQFYTLATDTGRPFTDMVLEAIQIEKKNKIHIFRH